MKKEALLDIMNEIDDKYIDSASEALEYYRNNQASVYSSEPAAKPFRKHYLAPALCAAAVFAGVFAVILNIGRFNVTEKPDDSITSNGNITTSVSDAQNKPPLEALDRTELEKIFGVFNELAYIDKGLHPFFDYAAYACDHIPDCFDISERFSEEVEGHKGENTYKNTYNYYLVKSGDYSTESSFNNKLGEIFTEDFKNKYLEYAKDNFRFKDGKTYAADTMLSNETISFRLEAGAEISDNNTSFTLADNYGNTAVVCLEKGNDGKYRISEADNIYRLSNWFSFDRDLELVYNDIKISRPSARSTAVSSKYNELWSQTSFEQCISMLRDYAYIGWDIAARVKYEADDNVTEDWSDKIFYKLNDDNKLADENVFRQQLRLIFTENAFEKYATDFGRNFTFKDGKAYVAENPPQNIAADVNGYMELNTFEIDENTALMTITAVGADGGSDRKFTIRFVKEGDFYKIDKIFAEGEEIDLAEFLSFYSKIVYGDMSISI